MTEPAGPQPSEAEARETREWLDSLDYVLHEGGPKFVNGEFQARLMLPLSLSYDHRVIDGADAARFLRRIVEALEEPFTMAL